MIERNPLVDSEMIYYTNEQPPIICPLGTKWLAFQIDYNKSDANEQGRLIYIFAYICAMSRNIPLVTIANELADIP